MATTWTILFERGHNFTGTNHGKNKPAQSFGEMLATAEQTKKSGKIYRQESSEFVDGKISELVRRTASELANVADTEPISLKETERIKEKTILYLRACEQASCFPSIIGLARALGLSRQSIYDCIWRGTPEATAQWLEICRDAFSDALGEAALRGTATAIPAIFLQKSVYGLRESIEVIAKKDDLSVENIDLDGLRSRIEESIPIEVDFNEMEENI